MEEAKLSKNLETAEEKAPLVSIVMPTYNVEEYLPDTLDGLAKQTFRDFEIIFVDDGSQDKTVSMLQDFAAKDSRATVLQQAHQYAGAARNLGIQHARGKYLLFLDGDDFFWTKMLEKSVEKAERTGSDICVFRVNRMDYETGEISAMPWSMRIELCTKEAVFSIKTNPKHIFEFTTAAPWNKLYRTDFVRRFGLTFQETRQSNDIAFICTSLALASKISVIDEDLQTHRFNNKNSLQGTNDKKPDCFYEALQELKNRLLKYGVYEQAEPAFLNYVVNNSFYNLMTLKNAFSFEKIFYLIRDEIFKKLGVEERPDDYFSGYYRLAEIRSDFQSLSVYDFFQKWSARSKREPGDFYERTSVAAAEKGGFVKPDKRPKVSVIMPCLNSMAYLDECLSSVLAQTLQDIEIICVDADSTDGTAEYIREQAAKDSRISLLHSEKKSYGYQVNLGMNQARGEFLSIVESDDYIVPTMYEKLYMLAKRYSVEVVKSDFSRFYGDKKNRTFMPVSVLRDRTRYSQVKNVRIDSGIFDAYMLITPAIYSLNFLRKYQIHFHESLGASYQDNGFWFQILMHAERMWFYPESLYMLRRDNPNSSINSRGNVYAMCAEYDFIRELIGDEADIVKRFAPYCARKRFDNYKFTMERIADECKLDFLIRFAQDFRKIRDAGELHGDLFSDVAWKMLSDIMEDPTRYYLSTYYQAQFSADGVHNKKPISSPTQRILRKINGLFMCIDEHGYVYTGKRILEHCGINMGTPDFKRKH